MCCAVLCRAVLRASDYSDHNNGHCSARSHWELCIFRAPKILPINSVVVIIIIVRIEHLRGGYQSLFIVLSSTNPIVLRRNNVTERTGSDSRPTAAKLSSAELKTIRTRPATILLPTNPMDDATELPNAENTVRSLRTTIPIQSVEPYHK